MIGHFRELFDCFNNAADMLFRSLALFEQLVIEKTSTDPTNQFSQKDPPGIRLCLFILVGLGNLTDYAECLSLFYTAKLLKQRFGFFVQRC